MLDMIPLRYFLSAYETGSISLAARANGVSQPSVSAAIQRLERDLEGALFLRSRQGLTATALGDRLYREAAPSVAHLTELPARLRPEVRQRVRLHCYPDVLLAPFTAPLQALIRRRPELIPEFAASPETCDLACVAEDCAPAGHVFLPLWEESYCVALARSHPLATATCLQPEDIQSLPRIHRPYCPTADQLYAYEAATGATPAPGAAAVNDQQVLDLVAAGLGLAFVPFTVGETHPGVALVPLSGITEVRRTVGISHRKTVLAREVAEEIAISFKEKLI